MPLMQVFDPLMCCSTGMCGPHVDATITRFAADLEWLKSQGVEVERYNLAQEPGVFADHAVVKSALAKSGENCLPLILVNGEIVAEGTYPSREELAVLVAVATNSLYSHAVEELVAIGAANASARDRSRAAIAAAPRGRLHR